MHSLSFACFSDEQSVWGWKCCPCTCLASAPVGLLLLFPCSLQWGQQGSTKEEQAFVFSSLTRMVRDNWKASKTKFQSFKRNNQSLCASKALESQGFKVLYTSYLFIQATNKGGLYLLSAYHVLGTYLSTLHEAVHLSLTTTQKHRCYQYPHSIDRETEA